MSSVTSSPGYLKLASANVVKQPEILAGLLSNLQLGLIDAKFGLNLAKLTEATTKYLNLLLAENLYNRNFV